MSSLSNNRRCTTKSANSVRMIKRVAMLLLFTVLIPGHGFSQGESVGQQMTYSIVDYSRSPQTSGSAAIDPLFHTSAIKDPQGNRQFPYFWTSTTHLDGHNPYSSAVYIAFGAAQGQMHNRLMDVHGAGAQRSDPKSGEQQDYPQYFGPQGDLRYVFNYVRCVRTTAP